MQKKILFLIMFCFLTMLCHAHIWEGGKGEPIQEGIGYFSGSSEGGGEGGGTSGWEPIDPTKTYYTVRLYDDDRTTLLYNEKIFVEGSNVDISPLVPSKRGHTFTRWLDSSNNEIASISNIQSDTSVYAQWDGGRLSITYYVDGDYQGIQFYDEGDTIVPLEAPYPYDAASDSQFVGWYNIPVDRVMPNQSLIATATIDTSYDIQFEWGVFTDSNLANYTGYMAKKIVSGGSSGVYKQPPVHNSYPIDVQYIDFQTGSLASLSNTITEFYVSPNVATMTSGNGLYQSLFHDCPIASATICCSSSKDPTLHMFSHNNHKTTLKYLNLAMPNVTVMGNSGTGTSGQYSSPSGIKNVTSMETLILPPNLTDWCGEFCRTCLNPIQMPDVSLLNLRGGYQGNAGYIMQSCYNIHLVFGTNTKVNLVNGSNYPVIKTSSNITLTFNGDYLPTVENAIVAQGSTITVEYHSSRGEWADPSFKENSALWGTLSQYTWVDLDAQP